MAALNASIEELFKAGAHFGYSRSSSHPRMRDFLFGLRNNVEIFDLEKTMARLQEAKDFLKKLGKEKKQVLFVGTKAGIKDLTEKCAEEADMPFVTERWLGGTFTNFKKIKERCDYMQDLIQKKDSGELAKYTKKERFQIEKKVKRLKQYFSGLEKMKNLPSAIIVVDIGEEKIAVKEANDMLIPVIGIMNSDCDPDAADYPIPANDNSIASVGLILKELTEAYLSGVNEAPEPSA